MFHRLVARHLFLKRILLGRRKSLKLDDATKTTEGEPVIIAPQFEDKVEVEVWKVKDVSLSIHCIDS